MNPNWATTTWGVGEYELMAERLRPVAQELVSLASVGPEDAVLDLACGTGNAALIAALHGASVVGLDFEPRLLEIAASRAEASGAQIEWICADVLSRELPEQAFSAVVSAFGVMYVPDQAAAAAAIARTSARGARVALAAWTPGSFMPAMGAVFGPYLPPLPPGDPPSRWGDDNGLIDRLRPHGIHVRTTRRSAVRLTFADIAEAREFLVRTAGNVLAERQGLEREGRWDALERDLEDLINERNGADVPGVELECEYLIVLAEAGIESAVGAS